MNNSAPNRRGFFKSTLVLASVFLVRAVEQSFAAAVTTSSHVVRSGESLSEIAVRYGLSVSQLKEINGLRSDTILVGQRLRLQKSWKYLQSDAVDIRNLDARRWRNIILHHSATPNGNAAIFDRYHRRRHMENGVAYHFVIGNGTNSRDGLIEITHRWKEQLNGGHVKSESLNANSIGICLVGNFQLKRPTPRQVVAAGELLQFFGGRLSERRPKLYLHRELEQTLCPGRFFPTKTIKASYPMA